MPSHLALLRGVNVGGKSLIGMPALCASLESAGLGSVTTYIQSGNVLFDAAEADHGRLEQMITGRIHADFDLDVASAVFTAAEWGAVAAHAPSWWGTTPGWKDNLLVTLRPMTTAQVVDEIGPLKPELEALEAGDRVVYQSIALAGFGRSAGGKLAAKPAYKQLTIRNRNTTLKLAILLT